VRSKLKRLAIAVGWLAVTTTLLAGQPAPPAPNAPSPPPAPDFEYQPEARPFQFSAVADTRFSDYKKNPSASYPKIRQALLKRIADEKHDFVLIAGDIVYKGAHLHDWKNFDEERKVLAEAGVRILPALGNHDLEGGDPAVALNNYFSRFPELGGRRWYSVRYGPLYLLMLDSLSSMDEGTPQGGWLRARLDHLPEGVDYVVLVLHHPSYSRSSERFMGMFGGGHKTRPQERRLAQLLEKRAQALPAHLIQIAGHVHNYERYTYGGVQYIVNGGGGSPSHNVKRQPEDSYKEIGPTFGLCRFTVDRQHLRFELLRAEVLPDRVVWSVQDSFELKPKP
jgi:Icc-related predicted phosphoesterase